MRLLLKKTKIRSTKLALKQKYQANIDILRAMKVVLKKLRNRDCIVTIEHVYGHQDQKKEK
jgi:hypothetical protein